VFATLHTQDAAQTIDRIIDVYPSHQQDQIRTQLAATLQGVVSQTLVRAHPEPSCYRHEILITTPAIANLVREGKAHQINLEHAGRVARLGMHTMDQHLADLVNEGRSPTRRPSEKGARPRLSRAAHPSRRTHWIGDDIKKRKPVRRHRARKH